MSKAILVMDMPDGCRHCRFSHDDWCESEDVYGKMCSLMYDWLIECFYTERADFCPLVPMPKKMLTDCDGNLTQMTANEALAIGWNACLNAIEGDEND